MSNPKFSLNQKVSVLVDLPECHIHIPETLITRIDPQPAGETYENPYGVTRGSQFDSWQYWVADFEAGFFNERYLRPINPDTEYLESTQDNALPVDGVSA